MVTKFTNILSDSLYTDVLEHLEYVKKEKSDSFNTSFTTWHPNLVNTSSPILRYTMASNDMHIFSKIKKELESKIPYYVSNAVFHLYPNLSYITWHDDTHADAGLTIYLNEFWDYNWGGYLMYKENDEIKAIKPEKNLGVLQENKVKHCVTTTTIGAPVRTSLQFFLHKTKKLY
jgi:Rps23 Pro-64 3,4-dihydroxylase Tpa1-like proline 4-hydroxylase